MHSSWRFLILGKFSFVLGEGMIMGRWPLISCGSYQEDNLGRLFPGYVFLP